MYGGTIEGLWLLLDGFSCGWLDYRDWDSLWQPGSEVIGLTAPCRITVSLRMRLSWPQPTPLCTVSTLMDGCLILGTIGKTLKLCKVSSLLLDCDVG